MAGDFGLLQEPGLCKVSFWNEGWVYLESVVQKFEANCNCEFICFSLYLPFRNGSLDRLFLLLQFWWFDFQKNASSSHFSVHFVCFIFLWHMCFLFGSTSFCMHKIKTLIVSRKFLWSLIFHFFWNWKFLFSKSQQVILEK